MATGCESMSGACRKRIQQLEADNKRLTQSNVALAAQLALFVPPKKRPVAPRGQVPGTGEPSYRKPTVSSGMRAGVGSSEPDPEGVPPRPTRAKALLRSGRFENGRPKYQLPTKSSSRKERQLFRGWEGWGACGWEYKSTEDLAEDLTEDSTEGSTDAAALESTDASTEESPDVSIEESASDLSDVPADVDLSLAARTRLSDSQWTCKDAYWVDISPKLGYRLLSKGYRLAQEIVYDFSRRHWPEVWRRFMHGPSCVKLETLFWEKLLTWNWGRRACCNVDGIDAYALRDVIAELPQIRNAYCHFGGAIGPYVEGPCENARYDYLLKHVHEAAVLTGDERRAFKVRALRDSLRQEAERELEAIKAREAIALLPFAGQWKLHHEDLFARMLRQRNDFRQLESVHKAVGRAALAWSETRSRAGEDREMAADRRG